MKKLFFTLCLMMIALPVMAEQPLNPIEVEAIPFTNTAPTFNTKSISAEIDMSAEVEHLATADAKKAGLPQFDVTTFASQIFWLAIMFVILYVYFAKSALPKLSSTIEQRHLTIKNDLEQADKITADVDKTRTDYELAMSNAHDNARKTIIDIEAHLRQDAETQANEFKDKSAQAISDLEAQAETAKAKIKSELNNIAAVLTSDIIKKLTPLKISDADIDTAVSTYTNSPNQKTKKAA